MQERAHLEEIDVPALIVMARDDLYNTCPAAEYTAQHSRTHGSPGSGRAATRWRGTRRGVRSAAAEFLREHSGAG
ncbi:MAG: hypothetical protein QMD46_08440 [Methanomicrobiales archaeon]|nr:hypothetical protein [Methanomicrobiales archaeon]MDI6876275.1 hypothetical protein [Methanomicrobiales archaeon]